VYIPSSKSSLYDVKWTNNDTTIHQPFPGLFEKQHFNESDPNPDAKNVGYALFHNHTRQQIRCLNG
jgi:hypothetical protein